jgi:outer membrane protein
MKNILIISNAVLLVAVIILFIFLYKTRSQVSALISPNDSTIVLTDSGKHGKGTTIAYINTDTVVENFSFYKEMKSSLENEQKIAENQLQAKLKDLEKEYKTLSTKVKLGLIKEEDAQQTFAIKQQEIELFRSNVSEKLLEKDKLMTEQLYDTIVNYVHRYNKNNKYTYILGYTKGGGIIYAPSSMDITQAILAGLNQEYEKKPKKSPKK